VLPDVGPGDLLAEVFRHVVHVLAVPPEEQPTDDKGHDENDAKPDFREEHRVRGELVGHGGDGDHQHLQEVHDEVLHAEEGPTLAVYAGGASPGPHDLGELPADEPAHDAADHGHDHLQHEPADVPVDERPAGRKPDPRDDPDGNREEIESPEEAAGEPVLRREGGGHEGPEHRDEGRGREAEDHR